MNFRSIALVASFFLALAGCADNGPAPLRESISAERLARIAPALQEEVDAGLRAGFVVLVAHDGEIAYEAAIGMADRENAVAMSQTTRFRIASMTKPLVTAALMRLVEEGAVLLDDPVSRYIPAFAQARVAISTKADADGGFATEPLKRPITIHDLLTHTSGIGYEFDFETDLGKLYVDNDLYRMEGDLAARIERLASLPLYAQPGDSFRYSYGIDVAGLVIEKASGQTLEDFMREHLFAPLGMRDTEFFFDETDMDRLAVVYAFDESGAMVRAKRPNEEAEGWHSGGGGLVSTARDFMRFCLAMLNEGELDGARILSPATVRLMLESHVAEEALPDEWRRSNTSFGLGGAIAQSPGLTGSFASPGEWGWGGYFETGFFISPADDLAVVVMAQREPGPTDPGSRSAKIVKSIAYGALE